MLNFAYSPGMSTAFFRRCSVAAHTGAMVYCASHRLACSRFHRSCAEKSTSCSVSGDCFRCSPGPKTRVFPASNTPDMPSSCSRRSSMARRSTSLSVSK